MRGERGIAWWDANVAAGSSPHARGTPLARASPPAPRRIIPACAGNAMAGDTSPLIGSDHPRMRGERFDTAVTLNSATGSSPHARGTPRRDRARAQHGRIIPACAGNAARAGDRSGAPSDHPRMRGERSAESSERSASVGSSPHARGTPGGGGHDRLRPRIIPACAGNAALRVSS